MSPVNERMLWMNLIPSFLRNELKKGILFMMWTFLIHLIGFEFENFIKSIESCQLIYFSDLHAKQIYMLVFLASGSLRL